MDDVTTNAPNNAHLKAARLASAAMWRVIDFALPPRCPGCGVIVVGSAGFCEACWRSLDPLAGPACARCSLPLPEADTGFDADDQRWCGRCTANTPPYVGAPAAFAYGQVAATVALRLKYGRRPGHARLMARIMRPRMITLLADHGQPELAPLLIPIPLNRWRLWSRGYNQAGLIADGLAAGQPSAPVAHDVLVRPKSSRSMRGRSRAARARAVQGAFVVRSEKAALLAGRHAILIDDVHASGATLDAAARVLRRAGSPLVSALTWARVVPDRQDDANSQDWSFDTLMDRTQMKP